MPCTVQLNLMIINKHMLEATILMQQAKYNYATSKLKWIKALLPSNIPQSITTPALPTGTHNYNQMKALCLIQL